MNIFLLVLYVNIPHFMLLTKQAKHLLKSRILIDDELQNEYIIINNRKVLIINLIDQIDPIDRIDSIEAI